MTSYLLQGGPRGGESVDSLPDDYVVVNVGIADVPVPGTDGIEQESHHFKASWRGDEEVILAVGPDYEDHEVMRRIELPDDAFLTSLTSEGRDVFAIDR